MYLKQRVDGRCSMRGFELKTYDMYLKPCEALREVVDVEDIQHVSKTTGDV